MLPPPDDRDAAFLKTLTVLHVEDEDLAREGLAIFLRRRVGRLLSAPDGAQGLRAWREAAPDILVTDIQMPLMDGLAMIEAIRAEGGLLPVVITTAFESTGYMLRAIDLGTERFVIKPILGERLEAALLACARRLRTEREMRAKERLEADMARMRHKAGLGILLGGVAHDYNNLLQGILASLETAQMMLPPDAPAAQVLALAGQSGQEARNLSRRLLALAGGIGQPRQVGPLDDLVRDVVGDALAGSPVTLELRLEASGDVPHDPANLGMALRNLADNAREAMPGGGRLQVSTARVRLEAGNALGLPPGCYVRIRMEDEGPGIPAELLPTIFDPYVSTKARGQQRGLGLGLALCEAVARAHKGAISAEPGSKGAVLSLHLPLAPGCAEGDLEG